MGDPFVYLSEWQVLLCTSCGYCLRPGREVWVRHLRQAPHLLRGASLKALVKLFASYVLRAAKAEPGRLPTEAISGLRADPASGCQSCVYADIIMPLCYGIFYGGGAEQWLLGQFQQRFKDVDEFLA
jgi:Orsellinic acid/F9775 biosynthesis cluster protein D